MGDYRVYGSLRPIRICAYYIELVINFILYNCANNGYEKRLNIFITVIVNKTLLNIYSLNNLSSNINSIINNIST